MTDVREAYFSSEWEWACCGGPLRVGELVELRVQEDSEYARSMRVELADVLSATLTGVETHHEDNDEAGIQVRNGRVTALHAVIEDMRWSVEPRTTPDPPARHLGEGMYAIAGNIAPGQASGKSIASTSRILPISVVPDPSAAPGDAEPDLARFGEQIRPHLAGYIITIDAS